MQRIRSILSVVLSGGVLITAAFGSMAMAEDYESSSFIVRDPISTVESGYASSDSFQYFSSSGQTVTGISSTDNFIDRSGFLYFPTATSVSVTATPGSAKVTLTWNAATATLATVQSYSLGVSTTSGGPYTFEDVGDELDFIKTGLTNGTTYFFVVRAVTGTLVLSQSDEVSATPTASGGGGGGGGGGQTSTTKVIFSGRAYPSSTVTLLKDAQIAGTTIAGTTANFEMTLTNVSGGNYTFALYSEDHEGHRSSLVTFTTSITSGTTTTISGIFIAPTISVDKAQVKRGDDLSIFGQAAPQADITIVVHSDQEFFAAETTDAAGIYLHHFDTAVLDYGGHDTKSKASIGNLEVSGYSSAASFTVGTDSIPTGTGGCGKADVNCDGRVDLVDFSITAYWYNRALTDAFRLVEAERLSGDGQVTLVDFSIMAYWWSG